MRVFAIFVASMLAIPSLATAQDWVSQSNQSDRAYYVAKSGDRSFQIGCSKGDSYIGFVLIGGKVPMFNDSVVQKPFLIWITHPDGRVARVPGDAEYLAGDENALIGRLMMGITHKEFFKEGISLVYDSDDRMLFETTMRGSAAALSEILAICPDA